LADTDQLQKEDWLKVLGVNFPSKDSLHDPPSANSAKVSVAGASAIAKAQSAYPSRPPPSHRVSAADNAALASMDADTLRSQDLAQRDCKELFSEKYMDTLVTAPPIKGVGDAKLKDIMRKLSKGVTPGERKTLIAELAKIRGVKAAELDMQYDRYMILRAQQSAVQQSKNGEAVPDLAEDVHDTFQGSKAQLLFGKVVGDAFGIDPVFGSMLSPTGGLVGPGNKSVQMDDESPTTYHGIVHDAAGYLKNYHNQGPGYDYMGREGRNTNDPYTGQQSGMRYWHEKLDPGVGTQVVCGVIDVTCSLVLDKDPVKAAKAAGTGAQKTAEQIKIRAEKALDTGRKIVSGAIDEAINTASGAAKTAGSALEQTAQDAAAAAQQVATTVAHSASTTVDSAKTTISAAGSAVKEKLGAAWDFVMGD
jgi:hypothetical protein